MDARKVAEDNLLCYILSGSHAYGMNTPTSDKDYRGLFYAPKNVVLSAFKNLEQVEGLGGEKDSVVYELAKYIKLLSEQNPNILELLWVDDKCILYGTSPYKLLLSHRDVFLSSKARITYSGYAMSQLKRMKGHNKWINNPQPARRPKEIDFLSSVWNRTANPEWNKQVPLQGFKAFQLGDNIIALSPVKWDYIWHDKHEALIVYPLSEASTPEKQNIDIIVKFNRQLYKEAVDNWQHYWQWKKDRNANRSELEEKFGYDTKHASHLIRLLRMGLEILKGEGVRVFRPDAQELLAIRNGKYTYEEILKEANELEAELQAVNTALPEEIDQKKADEILTDLYEWCWNLDNDPGLKMHWRIGYKYYVLTP